MSQEHSPNFRIHIQITEHGTNHLENIATHRMESVLEQTSANRLGNAGTASIGG